MSPAAFSNPYVRITTYPSPQLTHYLASHGHLLEKQNPISPSLDQTNFTDETLKRFEDPTLCLRLLTVDIIGIAKHVFMHKKQ